MPIEHSIFLIGYRGTGKSTVARHLAQRLGLEYLDSDKMIVEQAGQTIAEIFAKSGEASFRNIEQQVIASLGKDRPAVIALGGGAVLREANRLAIAGCAVVWLTASAAVLAERLSADTESDTQRPTLTGAGLTEEIEQVLAERMPIYRECATLVVDTDSRTAPEVAEKVYRQLACQ